MKITGIVVLIIIGMFALGFVGKAAGLFNIKFWGVKYENAHREVFEQTKSYNHGMIRDIENLCLEMKRVESDAHRSAIKSTIQHRMAAFNGELPLHVRQCLNQ